MTEGRPDPSRTVFLAGVASAAIYLSVTLAMPIGNSWAHVGRFLAAFGGASLLCFWVWHRLVRQPDGSRSIRLVLGFAVLFRLLLLPAGFSGPDPLTALGRDLGGERPGYGKFLLYDNDVWRYVWDGHMTVAGHSPYTWAPDTIEADDALAEELLDRELWWDVYDNIGFRALVTVYPPLAQQYFGLAARIAPGSVLLLKLGAVAADLLICWLLVDVLRRLRLPIGGVVLYAWNPLVLKEVAGSGHFEPLMILPMLAGIDWAVRRRGALSAGAVAVAALVKLSPLALVPVLARRLRWWHGLLGLGVLALGVLPYWSTLEGWLGTMVVYNREWHYNSGMWAVLETVLDLLGIEASARVAALVCRLAAVAVMVAVWWRDDGSASIAFRGAFFILAALVLLSPAVMPWYLIWALPFAVIAGFPAWAVLCSLSLLSYSFYAEEVEHVWWRLLEYGGFVLAWIAQRRLSPIDDPSPVDTSAESVG